MLETIVNQLMSTVKTRYSNVEFYDLSVHDMGAKLPTTCKSTFEYPEKINVKRTFSLNLIHIRMINFKKEPPKYFDYQICQSVTNKSD